VQNSLSIQVLHSPVLSVLLHGTQAVGISQTLQHGTRKGIMELSLLVCAIYTVSTKKQPLIMFKNLQN